MSASRATGAERDRMRQLVKIISGIASGLALLTALLYYFGWVRSQTQARALGTDVSVFGMSSPELVLRSADVLFIAVLGVSILLVLGIWLHYRLLDMLSGKSGRRRVDGIGRALSWTWLPAAVLAVVLLLAQPDAGSHLLPFLFTAAVGGTWYGQTLRQKTSDTDVAIPIALFLALSGLMAISLFWVTERVATVGGEARIAAIKQTPSESLSPVLVFTTQRLSAPPQGLVESILTEGNSALYRYKGAYFLQRSGGNYFLLVRGSSSPETRLVMVPEGLVARLEFAP